MWSVTTKATLVAQEKEQKKKLWHSLYLKHFISSNMIPSCVHWMQHCNFMTKKQISIFLWCLFVWFLFHTQNLVFCCTPPKKCRPALLCKLAVFSYEMLTKIVRLIKKLKSILGVLAFFFFFFCGGCADLMPFSTYLCKKKKHFYQELRDLGAFYFVSSTAI